MSPVQWRPVGAEERYRNIDIIRGLALFGVLIVNLMSDFRVPLLEYILMPHKGVVDLLVRGLLEFKALTIFSFLFGVGIAIQTERTAKRAVNATLFLMRRMACLFAIGLIHLLLIWNGDILTLYSLCGFMLVPCLRLPWRGLIALGAIAIVIPELVPLGLSIPSGSAATAQISQARQIYGSGTFPSILRFRWYETGSLIVPLLWWTFPRTVGLMYWGMAAWRGGLLRAPERHRGKLIAAMAAGSSGGGILTVNHLIATPVHALEHFDFAASLLLAMTYVAAALLLLKPGRAHALRRIASLGRMALTNYLLQSVVLGFVFYGYGLGLMEHLEPGTAVCMGLALCAVQAELSFRWIKRFQFGPVEWLWRSVAYGRMQPMVKALTQ